MNQQISKNGLMSRNFPDMNSGISQFTVLLVVLYKVKDEQFVDKHSLFYERWGL